MIDFDDTEYTYEPVVRCAVCGHVNYGDGWICPACLADASNADDPSTLLVPPPTRDDVLAEVAAQRRAQQAVDDFERLHPKDAD